MLFGILLNVLTPRQGHVGRTFCFCGRWVEGWWSIWQQHPTLTLVKHLDYMDLWVRALTAPEAFFRAPEGGCAKGGAHGAVFVSRTAEHRQSRTSTKAHATETPVRTEGVLGTLPFGRSLRPCRVDSTLLSKCALIVGFPYLVSLFAFRVRFPGVQNPLKSLPGARNRPPGPRNEVPEHNK